MDLGLAQLQQGLRKLPQRKISWGIAFAAVVYIAYLTAKSIWLLWPVEAVKAPMAEIAPGTAKHVAANIRKITEQAIFGDAKVEAVEAKPQPQVINDAPETRLSVNLTGVVAASGDKQAGLAIIESQGQQETYLVNDVIRGTRAKLAQVLPDRVILDVGGRFETLMLDGVSFSKKVSMPVPAATNELKRSTPEADREIDLSDNREVKQALHETKEELLEEPGKLFDYIRVTPERVEGELVGYRLSPGKDPALFEKMGLKNNDLAVAISGYELTDVQQAMLALEALRNSTEATITIERNGELIDVQFSL